MYSIKLICGSPNSCQVRSAANFSG
jgi:hypothetical protein